MLALVIAAIVAAVRINEVEAKRFLESRRRKSA
jgi:hypothetical protein